MHLKPSVSEIRFAKDRTINPRPVTPRHVICGELMKESERHKASVRGHLTVNGDICHGIAVINLVTAIYPSISMVGFFPPFLLMCPFAPGVKLRNHEREKNTSEKKRMLNRTRPDDDCRSPFVKT